MRVVAFFEAAKGVLVLLVGFGALSLVHEDVQRLAEELVRHFHFDLDGRYARIFVDAAIRTSDLRLWLLAGLAFGDAALRLVEAWGLWRGRSWAQWLAVAVGGTYVPIEVYELLHGVSALKVGTLIANIAIVLYMGGALWHSRRRRMTGRVGAPVAVLSR